MQYWLFPRRGTINLRVERGEYEKARRGDLVYFLEDSGAVSLYGIVSGREASHPQSETLRIRCEPAENRVGPRKTRALLDGEIPDEFTEVTGAAAEELASIVRERQPSFLEALGASLPSLQQIKQLPTLVMKKAGKPEPQAVAEAGATPEDAPRSQSTPESPESESPESPKPKAPGRSWIVPAVCRVERRVSAAVYRDIRPGARVLWHRGGEISADWGTVLAKRAWGEGRGRQYRTLVTLLPLADEIRLPSILEEEGDPPAKERQLSEEQAQRLRRATNRMPTSFEEAFREELDTIAELRERRGYLGRQIAEPVVYHQAHRAQLAGLAFSGGGIRSATFNLGVLQALAQRGLLPAFDYLSTVSGGGYIGSWLVAWLKRRGLTEVETELSSEHPQLARNRHLAAMEKRPRLTPITFLRRYSNFLTPRLGIFGADSWTVVATYTRNLLLNLLILVTALSALLLLPRIVVEMSAYLRLPGGRVWALTITLTALLIGLIYLFKNILALSDFLGEDGESDRAKGPASMGTGEVQIHVMLPLVVAAWAAACCIWLWGASEGVSETTTTGGLLLPEPARAALAEGLRLMLGLDVWLRWALGAGTLYLALWLPVSLAHALGLIFRRRSDWQESSFRTEAWRSSWNSSLLWGMAFVAGLGGGLLLWWLSEGLYRLTAGGGPLPAGPIWIPGLHGGVVAINIHQTGFPLIVLWGPPAMVLVMAVTAALHVGLMGRGFAEDHRQWWSRMGAWVMIFSVAWIGLFAIAIYGPAMLEWIALWSVPALGTISLGWVASTFVGIWAARGAGTGESRAGWLKLLAKAAPYVFMLGLLALLATGIQASIAAVLDDMPVTAGGIVRRHLELTWERPEVSLVALSATTILLALAALWLSYRIDINEFSMHLFYRNRLVRAYLGASRRRRPHPFTGFDRHDDLDLASILESSGNGSATADEGHEREYAGPLPILNTALNLAAGGDLAQQERKARSFFFTPLHYGFDTGVEPAKESDRSRLLVANEPFALRHTAAAAGGLGITLGTAMTVSGAAVSPNMGYHSSTPLAFLLTVFNARLGLWLGNPKRNATWEMAGPSIGLIYLLAELFGQTSDGSRYVSLADGGFFDNLGIYELVRRRCRYIVACDAEADPKLEFSGLSNAIRKCRSDFGVEIEIDVEPIRAAADSRLSNRHCAVGRVIYPDERTRSGFLVYLKASLTGDEPEDLIGYHRGNPCFPHQSTGDQWFDESQFESYRALGQHIAGEVFDVADLEAARAAGDGPVGLEPVCVDLRQAWYRPSVAIESSFTQHSTLLMGVFDRLRSEKNLAYLVPQVYRELGEWRAGRPVVVEAATPSEDGGEPGPLPSRPEELSPEQFKEGFFLCNSVIQLMENVYLDLELESEWVHPDNRGWMNLFGHWASSWMFWLTWAVSASTYGARFQKFCDRRLNIPAGLIRASETPGPPSARRLRELNGLERRLAHLVEENYELGKGSRLITLPLRLELTHPRSFARGGPVEPLFRFTFGFAILVEQPVAEGDLAGRRLLFLRVRDHLRKLGFGRRALHYLISFSGVDPELSDEDVARLEHVMPDYRHVQVRDLLLSVSTELEFERLSYGIEPDDW